MLRISISDSGSERRWFIQGRLVEPWVSELENVWEASRCEREERSCVVDLTDVTAIDERGEKVLKAMRQAGAVLIACGAYTSHVVAGINSQCKVRGKATIKNF